VKTRWPAPSAWSIRTCETGEGKISFPYDNLSGSRDPTELTHPLRTRYKVTFQAYETDARGAVVYHAGDLTVSLIARRRPELLEATLASIAETSPTEIVLQVLFNPPQDDVHEVVRRFARQWPGVVKLLSTNTPLNFVDAHNLALQHVETPLVNFMGDDDVNVGPRLIRQLDFLNTETDVLACGTFAYRVGGRPGQKLKMGGRAAIGPSTRGACDALVRSGQLVHLAFPSVVAKTEALRSIGGFRREFSIAADVDLWSRLALLGPVLSIPEYLFGFRVHDASGSTSLFWEGEERTRFAAACAKARSQGVPEPTLQEWRDASSQERFVNRWRTKRASTSRYYFRRAGAAFVERRYLTTARYLMTSFLLSPQACLGKLHGQLG
jgi:GT2 family glycosyltransferase